MSFGCKHEISCYSEWQVTGLGGYKHWKAILVYRCFKRDWFVNHYSKIPKYCGPNLHGDGCEFYEFGTHPLKGEGPGLSALRYDLKNPNRFKNGQ